MCCHLNECQQMESYYSDYFQDKHKQPKKHLQDDDYDTNTESSFASSGFKPKATQQAQSMNMKIYVTNMKSTTDERELSQVFMRFGEIVSIVHKGSYAFIEYAEPGCADEAIKEMSQPPNEYKVQMAYTKPSGMTQSKLTDFGND